jgi:pyruvate dehydrogenase E1 component
VREALRAQQILAERFDVASDVWSVTSYTELRRECVAIDRWNLMHPSEPARQSYLSRMLKRVSGPFVAASDYMKNLPGLIAPWVPGELVTLGTDGFGRSDTRPALRRFFEVDAECIALAALTSLMHRGELDRKSLQAAMGTLGINPDKLDPISS